MKRVDRFVGHAGLNREIAQGGKDGIRYTQARIAPSGTIFSRLPSPSGCHLIIAEIGLGPRIHPHLQ